MYREVSSKYFSWFFTLSRRKLEFGNLRCGEPPFVERSWFSNARAIFGNQSHLEFRLAAIGNNLRRALGFPQEFGEAGFCVLNGPSLFHLVLLTSLTSQSLIYRPIARKLSRISASTGAAAPRSLAARATDSD